MLHCYYSSVTNFTGYRLNDKITEYISNDQDSADEILQKRLAERERYALNVESQVDGISDKAVRILFRYIVWPLLMLLVLPAFSLFFFYTDHTISHVTFTTIFFVVSLLMMYKIKIKNRFRFYLIVTGILLALSLIIYIPNHRYYNITDVVHFMKVEEVESSFDMNDYEMLVSHGEVYNHVAFYTEFEQQFYYFDLNEELSEMDHLILLPGLELNAVTFYKEELYFSVRKEQSGVVTTQIYKLDFTDDTYELLRTLDGDYKIFEGVEGIYVTTTPFYSATPRVLLYRPNNDSLQSVNNISSHIYDLKPLSGDVFVAAVCDNECKIVRFTENFHEEKVLIDTGYSTQTLIRGAESVIAYHGGRLFSITDESMTELSEEFSSDELHFNYQGIYVFEGKLYDRELNLLSNIAYVDDEYYEGGAVYMYPANEEDMIVFQNYTTIRLQGIGIEISRLFIDSYFRHAYLIITVLSVGGIMLLGVKKKSI